MVVAIVALIAVGATSATAASLVTSKQIKNGTIQLGDLSRKARAKLRSGLCSPRLPDLRRCPGPQGVPGAAGAAGAAGATNVVMRQGPAVTATARLRERRRHLASPGERATDGGEACTTRTTSSIPSVTSSYPTPNPTTPPPTGNGQTPTGWRVWVANNYTPATSVTVYALCDLRRALIRPTGRRQVHHDS